MTRFEALQIALRGSHLKRALWVAVFVGTVLNAINQGDALLIDGRFNILKGLLTYCVPFGVSTYTAWSAVLESAREPS